MDSALFYFLIALITACLAEVSGRLKDRVQSSIAGLLSIFIPAFFAGIRYGIGTDYFFTYEPYYEYLAGRGDLLMHNRETLEIGYHALNLFFVKLGADFHVLLFTVSFLTLFFLRKAIWVYKANISTGIATFVFMMIYYQQTFNTVRQMLAGTIVLYAFHYIDRKKLFHFLAWVLFAMLFHVTAVVVIPFYWLGNMVVKDKNKVWTLIFYVIVTWMVFNFDKFGAIVDRLDASGYYSSYLEKVSDFEFSVGLLIRTVPYAAAACLMWPTIKQNRTVFLYMHSFLLGNILRIIVYMTRFDADRIALYFLLPQVIFIPYLAKPWKKSWRNMLGAIILIITVVVLWYFDYIFMGRAETVPYQSIFSTNSMYWGR